ncbi:hypothetical protein [Candidatus Nanohalobium constans]|uniref:Uncharacterized protein n=1 Tax=Candidatus Nanohalobium constans TaxID=2565781 RepID=A0A5Q0UFN7_9ARCH|nr:hypothetical protein [Candidatus Nanohalobium constans]QGA80432.1 hypothetical protein LC1Nh_0533 [Candidatus Nanohalobium constans]
MESFSLIVGFFAGLLVGGLGVVLYVRHKMMSQLSAMQGEMEDMFDMTDDLMDGMGQPGVEEADFQVEEKEDE